jgi:mRNA interferase MazF
MGAFAAGYIILIPFPFSDLSRSKLRPALLLASGGRNDWIACQITSNPYADPFAIELTIASFDTGGLQRVSYIRPGKLFTANESIILRQVGLLRGEVLDKARNAVVRVILGR